MILFQLLAAVMSMTFKKQQVIGENKMKMKKS